MKPGDDSYLERLNAAEAPELARSLGIMKAQVPDASQLAALAAQLSAQGLPIASGKGAAPLARGLTPLRKYSLLVGSGLLALGGALILLRERSVEHRPAAGLDHPIELQAPSVRVAPSAKGGEREASGSPRAVAEANTPGSESTAAVPEPPVEPTHAELPAPPLKSGTTGTAGTANIPPPAPGSSSGATKPPRSSAGASSSGAEPNAPARPSELALLRDARLSLRSSPAQALALTEQHRLLYPRGAMTQERELIAISALVGSGRRTAALSRVAEFERNFPNSLYRKQITELVR